MTDIDKAVEILKSTSNGSDLDVHHRKIVEAALRGDLGDETGVRLVFEDIFEKMTSSSAEVE